VVISSPLLGHCECLGTGEKQVLGDAYLLRRLVAKADASADGHLTIMKFTVNWRVGFGTPANQEDVYRMPQGATFREAAEAALKRRNPPASRKMGGETDAKKPFPDASPIYTARGHCNTATCP
jgi:hypothetical protein